MAGAMLDQGQPISPRAAQPPAAEPRRESPAGGAGDPLQALLGSLATLAAELRRLAQVRADQARLVLREFLGRIVLWAALLAGAGLVAVVGAAYVMHGTALGLARACGDRLWLGYVLAGLLFLGAACGTMWFGARRRQAQEWRRMLEKYCAADAQETHDEQSDAAQPRD